MDKRKLVDELCSYSSRPTSSLEQTGFFKLFERYIQDDEVVVDYQSFRTPYHFIHVLYWLFGGLIISLLLSFSWPIYGVLLSSFLAFQAFMYFDWRQSLLTKLPPVTKANNFIAKKKNTKSPRTLVLMAHWDTAPISIPYLPSMIKNFRLNIWIGMVFITLSSLVSIVKSLGYNPTWIMITTVLLIGYFILQMLIISVDFWRYGYSNGANDNATGCAVALDIANQLWNNKELDCTIEVVITGAEETGMLGAKAYLESQDFDKANTLIINFDTVGCEKLHVVTDTGTFTDIFYDEELLVASKEICKKLKMNAHFGTYRTADVDTAWFARKNIPCLSIISHNRDGVPSGIHRPEDLPDSIKWNTVEYATMLGLEIADHWITIKKE